MHLPINNLKWDFYSLYELPLYAPFTLSKEDMFDCMLQFYLRHKQVTNRQLIGYFGDTDHLNGQIPVILTIP